MHSSQVGTGSERSPLLASKSVSRLQPTDNHEDGREPVKSEPSQRMVM